MPIRPLLLLALALTIAAPAALAGPPDSKGQARSLPPGLAKKEQLPPGWEKKVRAGQVLDARMLMHVQPVPPEETAYEEPEGVVTVTIGDRVARIMRDTRRVIEVLD